MLSSLIAKVVGNAGEKGFYPGHKTFHIVCPQVMYKVGSIKFAPYILSGHINTVTFYIKINMKNRIFHPFFFHSGNRQTLDYAGVPATGISSLMPGTGPNRESSGPSFMADDMICSQVTNLPVYADSRPMMAMRVDCTCCSTSLTG